MRLQFAARSVLTGLSALGIAACATPDEQVGVRPDTDLSAEVSLRAENPMSVMEGSLNFAAKLICSDTFIVGRDTNDIIEQSLLAGGRAEAFPTIVSDHFPYTPARFEAALRSVAIDHDAGRVELRAGPYRGAARFYGDQGCVLLPPYRDDAYFEPQQTPRPEDDGLFGAGDDMLASNGQLPETYDRDQLQAAIDVALAPETMGAAFMVVHRGGRVIERYAEGIDAETPTLNWSMGKSLLGTLIGRLEYMGAIDLDAPAPIDLWQADENDPRSKITTLDLLRMSGGLSCDRNVPVWRRRLAVDAHNYIYSAPVNVLQHAIHSPVVAAPNEQHNYSNCEMQALGYIVRQFADQDGDYLTWPHRVLYNPLGMSGLVSEVDTYGNFHLTGYDYGTARDWARYGLLHLNNGVWNGERLLSEDFIEAARTPGPVWFDGEDGALGDYRLTYGAAHWLNTGGRYAVPRDAFFPQGYSGNFAFVVPSEDLVVVILRFTGTPADRADVNAVLRPLMAGLGIAVE